MSTTATAEQTPTSAPPSGRDSRGRFCAGNPGGPGNPFARKVAALRTALLNSIDAEDIAAIARALIERAKGGDVAAARLVLAYTLGKPAPAVDPDRLDADEWEHHKEHAEMFREMPQVGQAPEPELPLQTVRKSRPVMTKLWFDRMAAMLLGTDAGPAPPSPHGENGCSAAAAPSPSGGDGGRADSGREPDPALDPILWQFMQELLTPAPTVDSAAALGQAADGKCRQTATAVPP